MERTPLHELRHDELIALILRLQDRLSNLEARDREHVKLIEQQAKRIAELEKKNPTQRLDEAYSLKAEDKRRKDAQQRGKSKKRSRSPHGADESQRLKNWPSPLMQKMCGRANIR